MAFDQETNLIYKLDVIKEIRSKSLNLEKIKAKLLQDLQLISTEDKHLRSYQLELDSLRREHHMHADALRVLSADIEMMEHTIHDAEESRGKICNVVNSLLESQYKPMKEEIDHQRLLIGLEKLPDLSEEYEKLTKVVQCDPRSSIGVLLPCNSETQLGSPISSSSTSTGYAKCVSQQSTSASRRRASRPPMKQCEACYQMIHRNAPVCPLCKSKSRSKNPKKAKKKASSSSM